MARGRRAGRLLALLAALGLAALPGCAGRGGAGASAAARDETPLRVGEHVFHRRTLANGLRAAAVRDAGETVTVFVVVGVGARQETPETVGLAHLTEHAMFAGTEAVGDGELVRRVEGWGGEANAYTRQDYTLFYDHELPPERLEAVLALEADRLRGLAFEPEAVLAERERLRAEEAHTQLPAEARSEALEAEVYQVHPYRAGRRDARGHTRAPELGVEAVRAFYDAGYHPRNTAVVVVGPLDPESALDAVEVAFGGLPAGPAPAPPAEEPWPRAPREVRLPSTFARDQLELVWLVPERADPARPTLAVLAAWLDRQRLEDGRPVVASLGGRIDRELLRLSTSGEDAEPALLAVVARARTEGPEADELAAVKQRLRGRFSGLPLRARPYFSLAASFGVHAVADQAELVAGWEAAVDGVTREDVREAARRHLDPERRIAVVFEGTGAVVAALPEDAAGLRTAAIDASESGDYERALAAYGRLLEGSPNRMNQVIYLASRGQIHLRRRDYDAAIADFETALAVVDYPAVRELLDDAHRRKAAALRGRFEEPPPAPRGRPAAAPPRAAADRGELTEQVAALRAELEAWRGLRFATPVEPEFVESAPAAGVGGWYEPDTGRLVVVVSEQEAFSRGVQVHELFHALQDQAWDLSVLQQAARTRDERRALQGLIEGEAMLAVSELLDYDFEQHARLPAEGPVDRGTFEKIFQYGTGLRFVRALRDEGADGWPAVNRAWGAPPRSTAELYHPERYPAAPGALEPAEPAPDALREDVLGEFELRWLLVEEPRTRALADELGSALRDDRWLLLEDADGRRERWELGFRDEAAARRLAEEGEPAWRRAGWEARRKGARVVLTRPHARPHARSATR